MNEENIIQSMAARAANYTPEWNFDMEEADIGSALAYVYADMTEDTLRQLKRMKEKHRLAFFNSLGAEPRGASSARGFAVLSLVPNAPGGTEMNAHTVMTAETEDGGSARFETEEDLYVTPSQPVCLYLADGNKDGIYRLSDNLKELSAPVALFEERGENLQRHELYLAHEEILGAEGESEIEIRINVRRGQPLKAEQLKFFTDPENVDFSYWTGEEWQVFSKIELGWNSLLLQKKAFLPAFGKMQLGGKETYVIRCLVKDITGIGELSAEEILLGSRGSRLRPKYIYGASMECSLKEFFPFGERMNLYEEVYFGSEEALTKRGAEITLSFSLDFARVPIETAVEETPIEWKWIMQSSEFHTDPEYDITVEEVVWEYYNGTGWSRLFPGSEYSDIFGNDPKTGNRKRTLSFQCPQDMMPILINSCEACYIRARILKMNNLYKLKGSYIAPIIGNPMFSYDYGDGLTPPQVLSIENNGERHTASYEEIKKAGEAILLFTGLPQKGKSLYLGFRKPPIGSLVRMLWVFENASIEKRGSIRWEYESSRGFLEMNAADLTDHLSRSGTVTFIGKEDFQKSFHFGQELYWIRLWDEDGFYSEHKVQRTYPILKGLWMNAVKIRHREREITESFTLDYYEEDCSFHLRQGNIDEISVEVLEGSEEEEHWVIWEEVANLKLQPGGSRVCQVDRSAGILHFGNGIHGQVPPFGRSGGIRVRYRCGGGSRGNVAPGKVGRLNRTVGFVSKVTNPLPLWGGLDQETISETVNRFSARLRHTDRAVTARDYEELAMEATGVLSKVRCFGGRNDKGEEEAGAVTLVIYLKGGKEDKNLFYAVQEDIRRYLTSRMDPGILKRGRFYITEPKLAEIGVRAEVVVDDFQDIFTVRRMAREKIRAFLDPVSGQHDGRGWNIGQFPEAMQIQNILQGIPQIQWISKLYFMTFVNGPKGRQEADFLSIRRHPFVLPGFGETEVVVTVKGR